MLKITSTSELKEAILLLEETQITKDRILKEHFLVVLESIKPLNIIKSTFSEVVSSSNLINNIFGTTTGLAAGYLSNKTIVGSSANVLKKLLGTLLQFGVSTIILKKHEEINAHGHSFFQRFLGKESS